LPEYLRSDRQLALYMIGVQMQYPDVRDVRLIWHFLKFDKEVDSTRTQQELEVLKRSTIQLIDEIEGETEYKATPGFLCDWCEYQSVCGQWKHLHMVREKPANEYMKDSGVVLVNRYAEMRQKQKVFNTEVDGELEKLEEALLLFAEKEKVECVFGSKNKVKISTSERFCFPSKGSKDRRQLEELLKKYGKLQEVLQLDTASLGKIIQEKEWEPEVLESLKKILSWRRRNGCI
jgi:putative RecB family exonuclease